MFQFCESLISSCGLERFLDIYGVLPLVRPEEEESPSAREGNYNNAFLIALLKVVGRID